MSNYDIHLIIKQFAAQFPLDKVRAIPENTEKYISVSLDVPGDPKKYSCLTSIK